MTEIRTMTAADSGAVVEMMRTFYASPALITNGSEAIFQSNVRECLAGSPFLKGFVLEKDGETAGYGMVSFGFNTEFGRPCVWVEDLYLKPAFRGQGMGSAFLQFVRRSYPDALMRLEVERGNGRALRIKKKNGMQELPYREMISVPE